MVLLACGQGKEEDALHWASFWGFSEIEPRCYRLASENHP